MVYHKAINHKIYNPHSILNPNKTKKTGFMAGFFVL